MNSPAPLRASPGSDPPKSGSLADSPWFWAYLFASGALVALFLARPRYVERQPQLERQYKARQEGGQVVAGENGPVEPSNADRMILPLTPLYAALAVLLIVAWSGLWLQRYRRRTARQAADSPGLPGGQRSPPSKS